MADRIGFGIEEFARAFDEFFDELLINRWKFPRPGGQSERAQVLDYPDRYEVSLAAPGADPAQIQVEAAGQRLTVRIPIRSGGTIESVFSFAAAIDPKAAVTHWSDGTLTIIVPKKKGRRGPVKTS